MILSKYSGIFSNTDDPDSVTFFSTKRASIITIPSSMPPDIEKERISDEEKKVLHKLGFLVESEAGERKELLTYIDELNGMNKKLEAIVVLNLDCNLSCRYCYEGQRKGEFYMTGRTADDIMDFIRANKDGKDEIRIIFYGGEPLLSLDLIIYISQKLKAVAEAEGLKYSFSFITNGTLLGVSKVKQLKPLGLSSASITLDGPKEVHDSFRPFKSGNGSFDLILRNLKDICSLTSIQITGNFTQENYRLFPRLLDVFSDNGLTPEKISNVKFDPVTKETAEFAPRDFHDGNESLNEPWLYEAGPFLREEILRRGYRTPKITPAICMIEYQNYIVINYDGSIYKCPGFIGRQELQIGDVKKGIKDYRCSHNLDNWKNEECLECAYLPLCFGGCRYSKLVRDGNMEGVDCKKAYLDATLEAFVKQDIKYRLTA